MTDHVDPRIAPAAAAIAEVFDLAAGPNHKREPLLLDYDAARAALAAADKAATITTVEELDALPLGSVILCASGFSAQKTGAIDQLWWRTWNEIEVRGGAMNELPARVIHWGTE